MVFDWLNINNMFEIPFQMVCMIRLHGLFGPLTNSKEIRKLIWVVCIVYILSSKLNEVDIFNLFLAFFCLWLFMRYSIIPLSLDVYD